MSTENEINEQELTKERIFLGYPLDLLLNRECRFSAYQKKIGTLEKPDLDSEGEIGGIVLPYSEENKNGSIIYKPGTGNIIIRGKPGTAKSTLALQLASASTNIRNNFISFYISLEESPDNVWNKTESLGWQNRCVILNQLSEPDELNSAKNFSEHLIGIFPLLLNDDNKYKMIRNVFRDKNLTDEQKKSISDQNTVSKLAKVLVTTLSPRNIIIPDDSKDLLFLERYNQLERLLIAVSDYNYRVNSLKKKYSNSFTLPKVGMVCIDSLNVFGDKLLTRTELFRLFDLFKEYHVLGVFVVEEDEPFIYNAENKLHGETIEYLADVVISLTTGEDNGYFLRYFEITKSRYQHQVYGKHPFKMSDDVSNKRLKKVE